MTTDVAPHPLKTQMDAYGWLLVRLVPIFGTDRVVLGDAEEGTALAIGVHNGQFGTHLKGHSMWVERTAGSEVYRLNDLSEPQRETVMRHFIKDCKEALGWDA